jgi:hypothetical protein
MPSPTNIIVTEVTNMHNGHVCVGGWCAEEARMIRPLSGPREHWEAAVATPALFDVGNVVSLAPSDLPSGRGLPHAREDFVVNGKPVLAARLDTDELPLALRPSESPSMESLFDGLLKEARLVMTGSDCASLGAIQTNARRMGFEEKIKPSGATQLRCWFYDESNGRYNLPVVSRALQGVHTTRGLPAVNELKQGMRRAHLRIGLAHPFGDGRAFAMVNHVLFF